MGTEVPEKPTLDGLEDKWIERWEAEGTYRFDRSKARGEVYSIDTPPPSDLMPPALPWIPLHVISAVPVPVVWTA